MSTPRSMEVDKVWAEQPLDDDYKEDHEHHEDEVNYVGKAGHKGKGKGACYSNGEMGHRAAECPNKGAGKGPKGKGKGSPK